MSTRFVSCFVLNAVCAALLALAIVLAPTPLRAQNTGTITGVVTAVGTGAPISQAQVSVNGDPSEARTDEAGHFRLRAVPAGARVVRVLKLGFAPQSKQVTVVARETVVANFVLVDAPLSLEGIVVTGTAAVTRKKEVGNAIATIDMQALRNAPVLNTQQVLSASAPGVTVLANEGSPGAGGTIRLRGANSVTQGNNPIIYVDGIRIYSDQSPTIAGPRQTTNPFNDINPDDIDHIEVVKGAAATTLYGTQASGGVIQIFTKHGATGAPEWSLLASEGFNYEGHVGPSGDPTGLFMNRCSGIMTSGDGTQFTDPTCPASGSWFQKGPVQRFDLSVKGGGGQLSYAVAGNYNKEAGVVRTGYQNLGGFRGNFTFTPGRDLILALNTSYSANAIGWVPSGNYTSGLTLNAMRGPINNFKGGEHDDCANVPSTIVCVTNGYILDQQSTTNDDHFISGFTASWEPRVGLSNRFTAGVDKNFNTNQLLVPYGFLATPTGSLANAQWTHTKISLDYAGSFQHPLFGLLTTSSWGAQAFKDEDVRTNVNGTNLAGPGEPTLSSFSNITLGVATNQAVTNGGFFLQELLGWRDRAFLTAGLRVDGNSAFGQSFGLQSYPKLSAAYVISQESWWPTKLIPTLKLRGAIGESGKAPGAFDAVRTWTPTSGDQGTPGVSVSTLGNPGLGPEVTRESELGFDMSLIGNRLALEVTGYNSHTSRALISVQAPPSMGFANGQLMNVGSLDNKGLEVGLDAGIVRRAQFDWSARVSLTAMSSKVGYVGGVPIATGLGSFVTQGYPIGAYFGYKVENPTAKANPIIAANQYLGVVSPNHLVSLSTTIDFLHNFTLQALAEAQTGAILDNWVGYQGAKRFTWQPCYAAQAAMRAAASGDSTALSNVNALTRAQCSINAAVQNADFFYSKTDFLKIRDISLSYQIPPRFLRGRARFATLTAALRNPLGWTRYSGLNPESSDQSDAGSGLGRREYYQLPQYSTFLTSLRVTF